MTDTELNRRFAVLASQICSISATQSVVLSLCQTILHGQHEDGTPESFAAAVERLTELQLAGYRELYGAVLKQMGIVVKPNDTPPEWPTSIH